MEDKERVLKQDSVIYLKSKLISKKAVFFITENELVLEPCNTFINGRSIFNSGVNLKFIKRRKKIVIPIDSIKSINFNPQGNTIEFIDKRNKDFRIEFKKTEDWIAMINSKIRIINN